ncbi:putative quinol monooxygenase [Phyllobacterium sp. OV277]|uniref:putative quinol monooxygenase n=1 Tax=Phyllobacterium sp. OV277 TaxID=1882772 RepID=UPI000892021A|nr:putative quinol monooxygenase [Phyllobacterium sp. OV277]SDN88174.1 Quinol monooxygenase YgiN [Phyllobacterium sp. OV277]
MYGLIGKMQAVAGKRDELLGIMLADVSEMPGCLSYVIATDPTDADGIWITEVWDNQESHRNSLALASVQATITKARPLIAGFSNHTETVPIGGLGLNA